MFKVNLVDKDLDICVGEIFILSTAWQKSHPQSKDQIL